MEYKLKIRLYVEIDEWTKRIIGNLKLPLIFNLYFQFLVLLIPYHSPTLKGGFWVGGMVQHLRALMFL